ncbi:MAG TPA: hypothetical protein VFG58_07405 [Solirubrobacterales bacterium]|nr:hypothetical protein [Solirubrobacterales bacterium]
MSDNGQAVAAAKWSRAERLATLFSDPVRGRILSECNIREMSPRRFHRDLGMGTLAKLTQAFELLAQYGWLEETRSEQIADDPEQVERFYRGTEVGVIEEDTWVELPESTRALIGARILESLSIRTKEALKAGTIGGRPDQHLTWTPLELDRRGWDAVIARVDSLFYALAEEQEKARARMAESGEEPVWMTAGLLAFESPEYPPKWR